MSEKISQRSIKTWQRLAEWYGVRFIETYGKNPPDDWRKLIDATDSMTTARAMQIIRTRHVEFPPTFPQFEAAMRPQSSNGVRQVNPQDRLCKWIMRNYAGLTPKQIREPWEYFSKNGDFYGVIIAPDGSHPGHRITVDQMDAPEFQQPAPISEELPL
jgi:hypothetical protein